MTDYGRMILDFLNENPDYMLVSGWVEGRVGMKQKARAKSALYPLERKESGLLSLIGPLTKVDRKELANALYLLEQDKKLICTKLEDAGCTLEMCYTLPVESMKAAA